MSWAETHLSHNAIGDIENSIVMGGSINSISLKLDTVLFLSRSSKLVWRLHSNFTIFQVFMLISFQPLSKDVIVQGVDRS
jgi:hypothetical protein